MKKTKKQQRKMQMKYQKPISLYPLRAEDVFSAFMKINPKKVLRREKKEKKDKEEIIDE